MTSNDGGMEDVPSLEDYVKGLKKRDAEEDEERAAKRKKREAERAAFLEEQAEREKAEREKEERAKAAAAEAASAAATPVASAFDQSSEPFVKIKEPKDKIVEPCFDGMKGDERVERFVLDASQKTDWIVGRQMSLCDFTVSHDSCSRKHAQVQLWNGQVLITDLGTTHGTTVDGRLLPKNVPIRLTSGANVKFGASTRIYIFRMPKFHSKAMIAAAQANRATAPVRKKVSLSDFNDS